MLSRLPSSSGCGPGKKARLRGSLSSRCGKQADRTDVMDAAASRMPACVLYIRAGSVAGQAAYGEHSARHVQPGDETVELLRQPGTHICNSVAATSRFHMLPYILPDL